MAYIDDLTPANREEAYLDAIAGSDDAPTPSNRKEGFLAKIAGVAQTAYAALTNIFDKIPVNPTVDDVGKVMTVVADTSGEDPVYKWGALAANSGPVCIYSGSTKDSFSAPGSSHKTFHNIPTSTFTDDWAAISAKMRELSGTWGIVGYALEHFHIYAEGVRLVSVDTSAPTGTSILLQARGVVPGTVSDFIAEWKATINFPETAPSTAIAITYQLYELDGNTKITSAAALATYAGTYPNQRISYSVCK